MEGLGAVSLAGGAVWQRLTFDRMLDVPPPLLSFGAWVCVWGFFGIHLARGDAARRGAAALASLASAIHLWVMGWPGVGPGIDIEVYRFALARHLSTTWHGLPLQALVAMTGILACAFLCLQSTQSRVARAALATLVVLFGATTVLGYATGSPWPFGS